MSERSPSGVESISSPEVMIQALFDNEAGAIYDKRRTALSSDDPSRWDGIAFPMEFALELASVCNLRCVMCPVPTTSRPATLMDESVFRRVVDEVAQEHGYVLLPQGFGESFIHPKWAELLAHARLRKIRPIVLLTNGTLLREKNIARILDLEIDALVVSIDGIDPQTYASVRVGGNLETVERNVRRFLERRGSAGVPKLVLRIIRMKETEREIEGFFDRWRPLIGPSDEIHINEYNDWAGKVEDRRVSDAPRPPETRGPCRMLWYNLSVHADGKVSACCHDSEDELIVGDVTKGQSIRQIWQGERLARLRRIHREGRFEELPICLACKNFV